MKRHFPGLHAEAARANDFLEGLFLVRVDRAYYRWHPQKPFFILSFTVLEPKDVASRKISGRLYCTEKSLWRLNWFLRDFGYDTDLLGRDEVDEKALLGLTGVLRTNRKSFGCLFRSGRLNRSVLSGMAQISGRFSGVCQE
jgi:hypothetical protein